MLEAPAPSPLKSSWTHKFSSSSNALKRVPALSSVLYISSSAWYITSKLWKFPVVVTFKA